MLSLVTVIVVIVGTGTSAHPSTYSRHRVIGGEDASIEEYPYQVAIETEFETFLCGGSIISERILLSAAHSFSDLTDNDEREPENYLARVGSSSRQRDGKLYGFSSEKIVIHPNYGDEHKYDYDVAIIKLDEAIKFGLTAAKISIIPSGEEIMDETTLIVTGYGQISFDGKIPENLQVATMPKRNRDACNALGDQKLTDRMLCAGDGSSTVFHGDSGGPLTNAERKLVGIVSWGYQERNGKDPVVFTNIAHPDIHKFIMNHIS